MFFRFANLARWLIVAGAAVTAVSFAQAQSLMGPGQPIIFSTPDDGETVSNMPSLMAQQPVEPDFDSMVQAPKLKFQTPVSTGAQMPAPPQATISAAEADRRDWWMETPAEILGVNTPAQELKIKKFDAAGQPENPTAMERFYDRQNQTQTNGAGGFLNNATSLRGDFRENESEWLNENSPDMPRGRIGNQPPQATGSFQQPAPGNGAVASQNPDGDWLKNFSTAEQSPAQAKDMAEFQKMLEPSQPSKSSGNSSVDGLYSPLQKSEFDQPANVFRAPGQFNGGMGVLPSLPGVAGQSPAPTVTPTPDWKPQPPPWMLKGPQPGVMPQRVVW
jgi:hypothetical protein